VTNKSKRTVEPIDAQVGQAWSFHYKKQNEQAVTEFLRIVETEPNHIDANYGLGMSLAAVGRKAEAAQAFQKALAMAEEKLGQVEEEEDHARYAMLSRMIAQQLSVLDK
jgi:Flp pilus assembly protein TadD